jgi:hypothetical protein
MINVVWRMASLSVGLVRRVGRVTPAALPGRADVTAAGTFAGESFAESGEFNWISVPSA